MKYCKDCWSFGSCKAQGRTVDFPVDDGVCRHFDPILPQTNADRIRAMSDEELARWVMRFVFDSFIASGIEDPQWEDGMEEAMLEWLKQPAEGD